MKKCAHCKADFDPTEPVRTTTLNIETNEITMFEVKYDVKIAKGKEGEELAPVKKTAICPKCAGNAILSRVTADEAKIAAERIRKAQEDTNKHNKEQEEKKKGDGTDGIKADTPDDKAKPTK